MLFIFDMGGVVTNTFEFGQMYKRLGITSSDFFEICKSSGKDIWKEFQCGFIGTKEFWQLFEKSYVVTEGKAPEISLRHDLLRLYFHPVLNEKTAELIKALRKNNRVVCGTNTCESHWENHMERGDYALFDQSYASNKIGAVKPELDFFQLILEAEGCKPEEAFFTDDKIENVNAACKAGINGVQFTSAEDLWKQWEKYI